MRAARFYPLKRFCDSSKICKVLKRKSTQNVALCSPRTCVALLGFSAFSGALCASWRPYPGRGCQEGFWGLFCWDRSWLLAQKEAIKQRESCSIYFLRGLILANFHHQLLQRSAEIYLANVCFVTKSNASGWQNCSKQFDRKKKENPISLIKFLLMPWNKPWAEQVYLI